MISFLGVASLAVLALCITGLVLHYHVMKRRTRLDIAAEALEEAPEDENGASEAQRVEYEAALADYTACVSRFPWNIVARVLRLP